MHDEKTEDKVVTNGQRISYTDEELEKRVSAQRKWFYRNMGLGRYVKLVVDTNGFNENGLGNDMKKVLKIHKLHGKNMDIVDIEWRGW